MSLIKAPDNLDSLSTSRPETYRTIPSSPLSAMVKQNSMTPKVQPQKSNRVKSITPKRALAISIASTTSPGGLSGFRKNLELLTPSIDSTRRSKRPSVSSTRFSEASTKVGTALSLTKLSMKFLQSPQSLTSLHSESIATITHGNQAKNSLKSLNDFENQSNHGENRSHKEGNSFLLTSKDVIGEALGIRKGSFSSANPGVNLEKATESFNTQRSNVTTQTLMNKIEQLKENMLESPKIAKPEKRLKKPAKSFSRANRTKLSNQESTERTWNTQNTEIVSVRGEIDLDMLKVEKRTCLRSLNQGSSTQATPLTQRREKSQERRLVPSSGTGLSIKTFSETVSPQQRVNEQTRNEIGELPKTTVNVVNTKQEVVSRDEEIKKVDYEKLGRKGMMMKRLQESKTNRDQSARAEERAPVDDDEKNKSECVNVNAEKIVGKEDKETLEQEGSRTRRPVLKRVKSELQGARRGLISEFISGKDREQEVEAVMVKENEGVLEERCVNQRGEDREVGQTERSRRKRLEEWVKLKKREDNSGGQESVRVVEDMLRRKIGDESDQVREQSHEFQIFKREGNNFFELNADNKYLQKYNILKAVEENIRPDKLDTYQTIQTQRSEGLLKTSKSEKSLKTDPSTMMVRYYDELNPIVIQPKFMETTGSMCLTELWGNKTKQEFYKKMRKAFQSNTILSLNSNYGIYRPEKSIDSELLRHKRIKREQAENRENELSARSPSRQGENRSFLNSSCKLRHTRNFVFQPGNDGRPKSSARSFYSRDNL